MKVLIFSGFIPLSLKVSPGAYLSALAPVVQEVDGVYLLSPEVGETKEAS